MRLVNYINEQIEYKIYCDLDGVLVDFIKGIQDKVDPTMTGDWDEWVKIKKDTWSEVREMGASFWSDLEWTKDGKVLWSYIKKYNPIILTARPRTIKSAIKGKQQWVIQNLGPNKTIVLLGVEKQKYADEKSILIDDSPRNIKQWKSKGGIGVLHKNTPNTINILGQLEI